MDGFRAAKLGLSCLLKRPIQTIANFAPRCDFLFTFGTRLGSTHPLTRLAIAEPAKMSGLASKQQSLKIFEKLKTKQANKVSQLTHSNPLHSVSRPAKVLIGSPPDLL